MTVTVVSLLKRKAGTSREEFRTYYESNHRLIGEKVLSGYATRYVRRFLEPADGIDQDQDFDVILEIDFPDEATRKACFAAIGEPATLAMIVEDEEKLFDRSRMRTFNVTQSQSDMPPLA
ncbi:EthD domain-containing protein [Novosphingobium malaysiense]|uniref:EthD domain-containing protein n=1 Tax=Novosphingobium malaysiense TaxID=1348853 RepID=A0A0B1ZKT1_9SPHN|nr:EthD domain-containing protein [Novosphingobium malaysiense]KHK89895.1 hypothetical protein LK12_18490 [Novosphingobium malaysiense]